MVEKNDSMNLPDILLADDDSDDRELFEEAATIIDPNLRITMARDGEELMEVLLKGEKRPDLIFLDLNMPRKNGKECLAEISGNEELSNIPVIIYSTSINPTDIEDTYRNGAHFFFRKPNSFEQLKNILHQIIESGIENGAPRVREHFVLNGHHRVPLTRES